MVAFFILFGGHIRILGEQALSTTRSYLGRWTRDRIQVDQKTLARLRYTEGLTNLQLADKLGVSLTSVKIKLYDLDRTGNKKVKNGKTY